MHPEYDLTAHCNYGFNYDTVCTYNAVLKKFIEAHELSGSNLVYHNREKGVIRMNDERPMDFGGFGLPIDPNLFDIPECPNFSSGSSLLRDLMHTLIIDEMEKARMKKPKCTSAL
jgi:hypothetical protein